MAVLGFARTASGGGIRLHQTIKSSAKPVATISQLEAINNKTKELEYENKSY